MKQNQLLLAGICRFIFLWSTGAYPIAICSNLGKMYFNALCNALLLNVSNNGNNHSTKNFSSHLIIMKKTAIKKANNLLSASSEASIPPIPSEKSQQAQSQSKNLWWVPDDAQVSTILTLFSPIGVVLLFSHAMRILI
jgi:hypothetical protein